MKKPTSISTDDLNLFLEAIGDITPLNSNTPADTSQKPKPIPRQQEQDDRAVIDEIMSDYYDPGGLESGEEMQYVIPGIQKRVMRDLKRGRYAIQGELDLHGHTVPEARQALALFLYEARQNGQRCIKIIHGKGRRSSNQGPILKPLIGSWLQQRREVIAYCSAPPADGGNGALYLLLRKNS